jgi:excisionase family DNA binding protein
MANTEAQIVNPTSNDILTPDELALYLKVGRTWIYERTRRRGDIRCADVLPHFRLGLYLRFIKADVDAWINRQKSDYKRPNHAKQTL